jgi:hypothetical protein
LTGKALKEAKVENTARLQAGALLHEASHFIKEIDAGDYVDEQRKPSEVLRGTDLKTTDLAICKLDSFLPVSTLTKFTCKRYKGFRAIQKAR